MFTVSVYPAKMENLNKYQKPLISNETSGFLRHAIRDSLFQGIRLRFFTGIITLDKSECKKQQPETDSLTFRAGDTFYEVDRSALKLPELRVLLLFSGYWLP